MKRTTPRPPSLTTPKSFAHQEKSMEYPRTLKRVAQNNLIRLNASALQLLTFNTGEALLLIRRRLR